MFNKLSKSTFTYLWLACLLIAGVALSIFEPNVVIGKKLSVFSGVVENYSEKVEVTPIGDPHDTFVKDIVRTTYIAQFEIHGKKIIAQFPKKVLMQNGDRVSVCGVEENNQLKVIAFNNYTQTISQADAIWWLHILVGIVFLGLSCYIYFYVMKNPGWMEHFGILVFTLASVYLIHRGLFVRQAIQMLEKIS